MSKLIVYNASAGSGKTYTLSLEYISLCLKDENPWNFTRILAITFTNKAAAELKERVLHNLRSISQDEIPKEFMDKLSEKTSVSQVDLIKRAERCHKLMVYNYSDIHISTIDSFVLSIVKSFSLELGLAFDFSTELDITKVSELIVQDILSMVGHDKYVTEHLIRYAKDKLEGGQSWRPGHALDETVKQLLDEDSLEARSELGKLTQEELKQHLEDAELLLKELSTKIKKIQTSAKSLMDEKGLDSSDFKGKGRSFVLHFTKDYSKPFTVGPTSKLLDKVMSEPIANSDTLKNGRDNLVATVEQPLRTAFQTLFETLEKRKVYAVLLQNRLMILLAKRVQDLLKQLELSEGIGLLQSNNHRIASIVRNNPTPFIYERVGERFHHFLIDEFQDTSVLQWKNMLPLIDNSLSYGRKNFLVGDAKQSIYRFRSGEVEQIIKLPNIHEKGDDQILWEIERTFNQSHYTETLENNYRSGKAIVEFNNHTFSELRTKLLSPFIDAYSDVNQNAMKADNEGYVEMNLFDKQSKIKDALPKMLDQINECKEDGYEGSDVAILIRSKKDGKIIADFLEKEGIKVASQEELFLKNHPDILFLTSLLQIIDGTEFHKPYLYVMHRLLQRLDRLSEYSQRLKEYHQKPGLSSVNDLLSSDNSAFPWKRFQSKDAYYCLEYLIRELDLDEQDPYLGELMNHALSFSKDNSTSLAGFLDFWEEKKDKLALKMSPARDRIQLMTIHKSKGLQFPVVILPMVNWIRKNTKRYKWIPWSHQGPPYALVNLNSTLPTVEFQELYSNEMEKSKLDSLNLLYVAFTRPQHRLYCNISYSNNEGVGKDLHDYVSTLTTTSFHSGIKVKKSKDEIEHEPEVLQRISRSDRDRLLKITAGDRSRFHEERMFGEMVHQILERSNSTSSAENGLWAERFKGEDRWEEAVKVAKTTLSLEAQQNWNKDYPLVKNEIEVMDEDGQLHRLDKLYLNEQEKKALVLDYKTGQPDSAQKKQVTRYMDLISKMGYECQGYLLYTTTQELVRL